MNVINVIILAQNAWLQAPIVLSALQIQTEKNYLKWINVYVKIIIKRKLIKKFVVIIHVEIVYHNSSAVHALQMNIIEKLKLIKMVFVNVKMVILKIWMKSRNNAMHVYQTAKYVAILLNANNVLPIIFKQVKKINVFLIAPNWIEKNKDI